MLQFNRYNEPAKFHPLLDFDSYFDEKFSAKGSLADWFNRGSPQPLRPHVAVWEFAHGYELRAELPGIDYENVQIAIIDGVLTLEAKSEGREPSAGHPGNHPYHFLRQLTLPQDVTIEEITARLADEELRVTLPKTPEERFPD